MTPIAIDPGPIEAAFRAACADELQAAKPGNVHIHAAGHRMTADDFRRSAEAAAGPLCAPSASLGERVEGAVAATRAAMGQNTNLGIVLLCAPLAMAAQAIGDLEEGDLQQTVRRVIDATTLSDAAAVFRAITLAAPGGLGTAPLHDVRAPPAVRLPEAMGAAAWRDRIARQYATGFADVFGPLMVAYRAALDRHASRAWAALAAYLHCLANWPDSHVARKHGLAVAEAVRREAVAWAARLRDAAEPGALLPDLLVWDGELKRNGINPGTSADLTVAVIFAHRLGGSLAHLLPHPALPRPALP